MASNYTPQAGDVIESPSGRKRIRMLRGVDNMGEVATLTYRRKWWWWGPWGGLFGKQMGLTEWGLVKAWGISNLVDDHGWSIVSRKEAADGNRD